MSGLFSMSNLMEIKNELPSTLLTPLFDIDDLSFFRFYGLGLRHTELELGLKEAQSDDNCGDAVSLACYGREPGHWWQFSFDSQLCAPFQEKVEQFILSSYTNFHKVTNHYNDAAFALLIRGNCARYPYDFTSYPLGKCGKDNFTSAQIMGLINTQKYQNDDVEHAVYNTMMTLKTLCQRLKLSKLTELLETNPQWSPQINELISHYQNNTFLKKPYFLILSNLCNPANDRALPELSSLELEDKALDSILNTWIQEENYNTKKGSNTISVLYQPVDFTCMDAQSVSKRLCHYIKNQNIAKVKQCIHFLSNKEFNPEKDNTLQSPLQLAAHGQSTEILKAVYEYAPQLYDQLIDNENVSTPIFIAAYYSQKENLHYLLSVRTLIARDISYINNQNKVHCFLGLAESNDPDSYDIMCLLASMQVGCGFELEFDNDELYGNPLSLITRMWGQDDALNQKKFDLLLPHANAKSKYLAILSATCELFYSYGAKPREKKVYESTDRDIQIANYRNQIFLSLTKKECEEIHALACSGMSYSCSAEKILIGDLKIEIEGNPNKKLVAAIQNCFSELNLSEKAEQISLVQSHFFQQSHEEPVVRTTSLKQPQYPAEESNCCII